MTRVAAGAAFMLAGLAALEGAAGAGRQPDAEPSALSGLSVRSCCRAIDVLLVDAQGRRAGSPALVGAAATAIPRSNHLADTSLEDDVAGEDAADAGQEIEVMAPMPGEYALEVVGRAEGRYDLELRAFDQRVSRDARAAVLGVPISKGDRDRYRLAYGSEPAPALRLRGEWLGGGEPSQAADALLSFARPLADRVKRGPLRSARLVVAYAPHVVPASFRARLNGEDATRTFRPLPGGVEAVELPLRSGINVLELSVVGRPGDQELADTDEITFEADL